MRSIEIHRFKETNNQTNGVLLVLEDDDPIFACYTLELPDRGNQRNISRIPDGCYIVKKRTSRKFGEHFHIQDVPDRSYILIHAGNYHTDIRGCVLVGKELKQIGKDKELDTVYSKRTMKDLLDLMPDEFKIIIK
jgi:hypothetical protein